jgi:hypothetical protein
MAGMEKRINPPGTTVRKWQTFPEPFGLFSQSIWDSSPRHISLCPLERAWKAIKASTDVHVFSIGKLQGKQRKKANEQGEQIVRRESGV